MQYAVDLIIGEPRVLRVFFSHFFLSGIRVRFCIVGENL